MYFKSGVALRTVNVVLVPDEVIKKRISAVLELTNNGMSELENENDTKEVNIGKYTILFSYEDVVILDCTSNYGCSVVNQEVVWKEHNFISEFIYYIDKEKYKNA